MTHKAEKNASSSLPREIADSVRDLEAVWDGVQEDAEFWDRFDGLARDYAGRPGPLYFAQSCTRHFRGAKVYFKRDDLNHTGFCGVSTYLGYALLAQRMGKTRIVCDVKDVRAGASIAAVCAMLGLSCKVFMAASVVESRKADMFRIRLSGAETCPVPLDRNPAVEAMIDWAGRPDETLYVPGSDPAFEPYLAISKEFHSLTGSELRSQILDHEGRLPDALVASGASLGGMQGFFAPFLESLSVGLTCVLRAGTPAPSESEERIQTVFVEEEQALEALRLCAGLEGIVLPLEQAHVFAHVVEIAPTLPEDHILVMNLCARGDGDIVEIAAKLGEPLS